MPAGQRLEVRLLEVKPSLARPFGPQESGEKVLHNEESVPQALKRGHIFGDKAARVELVPFPISFKREFFRNF
jgi:hypothetical protein